MALMPRPCVRCGSMIPIERLDVMPETEICVTCSQEVGGEFKLIAVNERTSKPGSLKINYGGVTIKKIRKQLKPKAEN